MSRRTHPALSDRGAVGAQLSSGYRSSWSWRF